MEIVILPQSISVMGLILMFMGILLQYTTQYFEKEHLALFLTGTIFAILGVGLFQVTKEIILNINFFY